MCIRDSIENEPHPILKKGAKDILGNINNLKAAKSNGQPVFMKLTMEIKHNVPDKVESNSTLDTTVYEIRDYKNLVVDKITHLPECGAKETAKQKAICNFQELFKRYVNVYRYKTSARENGIEGKVIVSLLIESDGYVSRVELVQDIGGGVGQEVVETLEREISDKIKWIPSIKDSTPVRSKFYYIAEFTLR